ncbi:hypothetical protein C0J52_08540 [Blattella germanica]|nr:hypothetical protein C0J52_08540 [Blattella germanica]
MKKRLKKMLVSAAEDLGNHVQSLQDGRPRSEMERHALVIREECKQVREFLSSLVVSIFQEIQTEVVVEISNMFHANRINHDRDMALCESILRSVLLPCLEHCNLRRLNWLSIPLVIQNLHMVPNLLSLQVPPATISNYSDFLLQRINVLTELQVFSYEKDCTDEVVVHLCHYCKKLFILRIRASRRVTNAAVKHLLRLPGLRFLDIAGCKVTVEGYKVLLLRMPNLVNFAWFPILDEVLTRLVVDTLPAITEADGYVSDAFLLTGMCPNITHLTIAPSYGATDLSPLKKLVNLKSMILINYDFLSNRLREVIEERGSGLEKFFLVKISRVCFETIVTCCSSLKTLSFDHCQLLSMPANVSIDDELPHFESVEAIHFWSLRQPSFLYENLHLYRNLSRLYVRYPVHLNDLQINNITRRGGFRHLSEFIVHGSFDLTFASVEGLLAACPNLRKLGNLLTWINVISADVRYLQRLILQRNYDVTVT